MATDPHSRQAKLTTADDELPGKRIGRRATDAQHVCRFVDCKEIRPGPLDGDEIRSVAHTRQSTTGMPTCLIGPAAGFDVVWAAKRVCPLADTPSRCVAREGLSGQPSIACRQVRVRVD
jgi:hypothetical protein